MLLQLVLVGVYIVMYKGVADASISPMEKHEKEALYSAIQGFVGNEWNGSFLYPDPCGWTTIEGVSCDFYNGFWHVTDLTIGDLYENSLRCSQAAEFTEHLFNLKHLKRLSFSNCFLSDQHKSIPISNWDSLANSLESLEFRSNPGLIGTIPTSFGYLKNLQSLVLLENGLKGEIPEALGNLTKLKRLVLAGNNFIGPIPTSLGRLTNLLILDTSRNFLSGTLPVTIGDLSSLIKLDLSNNRLDGKLPREIGGLKSLTLLDLSYNNFSDGLPETFQEMDSLEELVLSDNPIGDYVTRIQWGNLKNLEMLDLSNMGLKGNIPNSMTEMKKLRFLSLSNNILSGIIPSKFEKISTINALYLDGNDFTGKLEFSQRFYTKLRSRFRASGNVKLCLSLELTSTSHVPEGVQPCEQESRVDSKDSDSNLENKYLSQNSQHIIASLGHSGHVDLSNPACVQGRFSAGSEITRNASQLIRFSSATLDSLIYKLEQPVLYYIIRGVSGAIC